MLADYGEITWEHGAGKGSGVYKTSLYQLILTCPPNCNGGWNHKLGQDVRSRGDNLSGLGVTRLADKEIIEPVIETNIETENNFQAFWEHYPRKDNKKPAMTTFRNLPKKTQLLAIEGAKAYARSQLPEPKFIPQAATWLNQERWTNDYKPRTTGWDF